MALLIIISLVACSDKLTPPTGGAGFAFPAIPGLDFSQWGSPRLNRDYDPGSFEGLGALDFSVSSTGNNAYLVTASGLMETDLNLKTSLAFIDIESCTPVGVLSKKAPGTLQLGSPGRLKMQLVASGMVHWWPLRLATAGKMSRLRCISASCADVRARRTAFDAFL